MCRLQQLDMPSRLTVVLVSLLVATPAVIFCLWLVVLSVRVIKLCPEKCWCDPGGYYIHCYNSSLNNIPFSFPTNVQYLVLDNNNITSLQKDSFISRGLTQLEYLSVSSCGLERIELGAFNGLTTLTDLTMSRNEISEITPYILEKMSRLQNLDLEDNSIEHLKVDVFLG
jgi:hypothetical protein